MARIYVVHVSRQAGGLRDGAGRRRGARGNLRQRRVGPALERRRSGAVLHRARRHACVRRGARDGRAESGEAHAAIPDPGHARGTAVREPLRRRSHRAAVSRPHAAGRSADAAAERAGELEPAVDVTLTRHPSSLPTHPRASMLASMLARTSRIPRVSRRNPSGVKRAVYVTSRLMSGLLPRCWTPPQGSLPCKGPSRVPARRGGTCWDRLSRSAAVARWVRFLASKSKSKELLAGCQARFPQLLTAA